MERYRLQPEENRPRETEININGEPIPTLEYLNKYGYQKGQEWLANRLHKTLAGGPKKITETMLETFGPRLAAYIAKEKRTGPIHDWAEGIAIPNQDTLVKFAIGVDCANSYLAIFESPIPEEQKTPELEEGREKRLQGEKAVFQALAQGLHPNLGDRSPATILRESPLAELSIIHRELLMDAVSDPMGS